MLRVSLCFVLLLLLLAPFSHAVAQSEGVTTLEDANPWIYWGKRGELGRTRLDGSQQEILLRGQARLETLALDPTGDALYLGDAGRGTVEAVSLETHQPRRELLLNRALSDMILHDGQLYVAGLHLLRLDPVSGDAQTVVERPLGPMPQEIAIGNGWIYWSTVQERIERARLDGMQHNDEFLWADSPRASLATDSEYLYGLEANGTLWRATLDGKGKRQLVQRDTPHAVELTHHGSRLYWAECPEPYKDGICTLVSASVEGNDILQLLERSEDITDLAVHGDALYWTEAQTLYRRPLAGGEPEAVIDDPPVRPEALAGDGQYLYRWEGARLQERQLIRSRLDGSASHVLLDGHPGELVGVDDDRLVWVEREVQRSKGLFGNSHVTKVYSAPLPTAEANTLQGGIELAAIGGSYQDMQMRQGWIYGLRDADVERLRLVADAKVETVVSGDQVRQEMMRFLQSGAAGPDKADHIASTDAWVFWADNNKNKISRMTLDGTRRRDVLGDLGYLTDMTAGEGHIVWSSDGTLFRAGLDGSEPTNLMEDLEGPDHLALHDGWIYFEQTHLEDGDLTPSLGRLPLQGGQLQILLRGDAVMGPGATLSRRQREHLIPGVMALAATDHGVVWAESATERLLHANHDGSNVRQLRLPETVDVNALDARGDVIYGADNERRLWRLHVHPDEPTSDPNLVPATQTHLRRLDGDVIADLAMGSESQLFWTARLSDSLVRFDLNQLHETPMLEAPPSPMDSFQMPKFAKHLAVDEDWVYLVDGISNSVDRMTLEGSDRRPWVQKLAKGAISGLYRAADQMVWIDVDGIWVAPMEQPEQRRKLVDRPGITTLAVVPTEP